MKHLSIHQYHPAQALKPEWTLLLVAGSLIVGMTVAIYWYAALLA